MATTIDYYFTLISPWAYLGHGALMAMARQHGAEVRFKPVSLGGVWEVSGSVPLAKRSATRQRYRLIELQRYSELRGLPLNLHPRHFPADPVLADRATAALVMEGHDPEGFMARIFAGAWAQDENIADAETVARFLEAEGHDASTLIEAAQGPATAAIYRQNTKEAIAADAIGVPTYVLNGEAFWGQDRLDMLERALDSGREPYRA
jgi:2-hydroxychromene-2-carboxylate isomerase